METAQASRADAPPVLRGKSKTLDDHVLPSSSAGFASPVHPIRPPTTHARPVRSTILPILLPPSTLRPLAFRTFTKKHSLTITSTALQSLATFIGKYCGSGWRDEGLAEKVLEEVARAWKKNGGQLIVDGQNKDFIEILKGLEGCMSGGKVVQQGGLSRQGSFVHSEHEKSAEQRHGNRPAHLGREDSNKSFGISALEVRDEEEDPGGKDPRQWLRVVDAFGQPRLAYNSHKKHFEKVTKPPSLFPDPLRKTDLFRHRYDMIQQRLLRNESFQAPTVVPARAPSLQHSESTFTAQQTYKLTPITNLLGRTGSAHVLLGLLTVSPTGTLAISDLTGNIALDISHARPEPKDGAWFTPGMIVIVDGIYEEEGSDIGGTLGGSGGIGGTIGGKFICLSIGGPPCERREVTLGIGGPSGDGSMSAGGGFGWVDFLGVGSERASGPRMRRLERKIFGRDGAAGRGKIAIIGEVNLDNPKSTQALRKVLGIYAAQPAEEMPMAFMLTGNFVTHAVMAGGGSGGSVEYKEYFDSLASALSDYPIVLQAATFIFVPGDNDPWSSAFSAGAASVLPRKGVPELFTSRIKRAFTAANAEAERASSSTANGEVIWTTNPSRLTLFGPAQEIVIFRDDISGRLRRSAIRFRSLGPERAGGAESSEVDGVPAEVDEMDVDQAIINAEAHIPTAEAPTSPPDDIITARKLVKTILDQAYLSPFPLSNRPVLWDYAGALQLYPLPTALMLVDPEAPPFAVTYEGCHVMNPGRLLAEGRKGVARWIEYDAGTRRGNIREVMF